MKGNKDNFGVAQKIKWKNYLGWVMKLPLDS